MKRVIPFLLVLLLAISASAQTIWKADLDNIKEDGYYNIEISQTLIGASEYKLKDLRIFDKDSVEVPYFLRSATPIQEVNNIEEYDLSQSIAKDSLNVIIISNKQKENLDKVYITINNADVKIQAGVRGSNDAKKWFIVKQSSSVPKHTEDRGNEATLILDFPSGNYPYYEITLTNNQNSPLEVKAVKRLKSSNIYGQFARTPFGDSIQVVNEGKQTLISFPSLNNSFLINKVEFFVKNRAEYFRTATLRDTVTYQSTSFNLSSRNNNFFYIEDFKLTKDGIITINNFDSQPLSIDSIRLYGLQRYACAYLEKDKQYTLVIDDELKKFPQYDIDHFKEDISLDIPTITTTNISSTKKPPIVVAQRELLLIEKPIFLWSIIIGVGLLLTLISVRMIINIKKRDK